MADDDAKDPPDTSPQGDGDAGDSTGTPTEEAEAERDET